MEKRGYLLIIAAGVLWGTTGTAQALAPAGAQPLAIGALRLLVSGAVLMAALASKNMLAGKSMHASKSMPTGKRPPFAQRLPAGPVLLAAACMAAYQVLFFAGVKMTGVAVGTIVGIGSSPVLAGLLGYIFRGERPGWRWGAATLLAVAGCVLLALSGESAAAAGINIDPLGMLLAVGAGGAYATFSLVSKNMLEQQPVERVMAVVFSLGALMLAPLLFTQDFGWLWQARGAAVILHLGVFATALAYTLFGKGLQRVTLATAVTLSLAEPLTAGMLGVLLLGERLTLLAGVGIALIFSGLVVLSVRAK